jgi:hypothetical protein
MNNLAYRWVRFVHAFVDQIDLSLYCLGNGLHRQRIGVQYQERAEIFFFSSLQEPSKLFIFAVDAVYMTVVRNGLFRVSVFPQDRFVWPYLFAPRYYHGDGGSTVVKVLCYRSEGLWFHPSDRTMAKY